MKDFICLSFVFVCFLLVRQNEASAAPALLWSPERSMSHLPEAGSGVSSDILLQDYLGPLMQQSAESSVIFLKDKLHVDDFTKFADVYSLDSNGGAFKNIKNFMEEHFSLELPQVEDPLKAVEKFKSSFGGSVHTAASLSDVEKLNLNPSERFLLIVELSPPAGVNDEEQAIASNDALVGSVCSHLQKRSIKYTAMFTGNSAEESKANEVETFSGRHLLAAPASNNGTLMNVSGIFVFLRDVKVHIREGGKDKQDLNFTVTIHSADKSTSDNKTALVQLDLQDAGGQHKAQIIFNISHTGDRWTIHRILLSVQGAATTNGTIDKALLNTGDMDLVVPILYSYHCSSMVLYVNTVRDTRMKNYAGTYVELNGLQMQPFNVQNNKFFNAQDCVGFFSRGIWMGIFSSTILLAILIFGTLMVLNLSTPDRFDDPKGKTIVIAQTEE